MGIIFWNFFSCSALIRLNTLELEKLKSSLLFSSSITVSSNSLIRLFESVSISRVKNPRSRRKSLIFSRSNVKPMSNKAAYNSLVSSDTFVHEPKSSNIIFSLAGVIRKFARFGSVCTN